MFRFVCLLVLLIPASAAAQSFALCDNVKRENMSSSSGPWGKLIYTVTTTTEGYDICVLAVSVRAEVRDIGNSDSGWKTRLMPNAATVSRDVWAPATGNWITKGYHGYYMPDPYRVWSYVDQGETQSFAWVIVYQQADLCTEQGVEYQWNYSTNTCDYWPGSPILIDVGRKGYQLTDRAHGVWFDLDGDGDKEQISWTAAGVENAWLCVDRNLNGRCDNGRELFGTSTPMHRDLTVSGGWTTAQNGFDALTIPERQLNRTFPDEQFSIADPMFATLLLWTDRNHNGWSEPSELVSAAAAGLRAISLNYDVLTGARDANGNSWKVRGKVKWATGDWVPAYDVFLATR